MGENPLALLFGGRAREAEENKQKHTPARRAKPKRDEASFQPRTEEEIQALVQQWSSYAHSRASVFFNSPEMLAEVLVQVARGIDRKDDPVLGQEEKCVYW